MILLNNVSAKAEENFAPSNEVVASINNNVTDARNARQIGFVQEPTLSAYPLSGVKLDKLGIFMPYFGEHTEEFVYKCSGRGDQSWRNLAQRIHDLDTANENLSAYVARLYEDFELNMLYDPLQIIKMVGTIRRELRMPIEEQSQKWYLQQVSNVFLIEKVMDKTSGYPKLIGYKLLFRLKP